MGAGGKNHVGEALLLQLLIGADIRVQADLRTHGPDQGLILVDGLGGNAELRNDMAHHTAQSAGGFKQSNGHPLPAQEEGRRLRPGPPPTTATFLPETAWTAFCWTEAHH